MPEKERTDSSKQSSQLSKNLFDFATKELSQDAFLRWLIESIYDPIVAPVSRAFLSWVTGYDGKIEVIKTFAQWHRIDVVAKLLYPDDYTTVLLAIEDKVNTGEHDNQLEKYDKSLEEWRSDKTKGKRSVEKVFYKSTNLEEEEKKRIEEEGWRVIELKDIASFFENYVSSVESEIVSSYAKHILRRKRISTQPMQKWDLIDFESWYWELFRHHVKKNIPQLNLEGKIYQGHYFSCYASRPYKNSKSLSVCFEIIFRSESEVSGVLYPRKDGGKSSLKNNLNT